LQAKASKRGTYIGRKTAVFHAVAWIPSLIKRYFAADSWGPEPEQLRTNCRNCYRNWNSSSSKNHSNDGNDGRKPETIQATKQPQQPKPTLQL
jgi:hypothetical protein